MGWIYFLDLELPVLSSALAVRACIKSTTRAIKSEECIMPKIIATHEVNDVAHWLTSPKRAEVFAGIATDIRTFVLPGNANRVALSMEVDNMDAFDAMMKTDAGAEAMKHDGVRPDTLVMYVES